MESCSKVAPLISVMADALMVCAMCVHARVLPEIDNVRLHRKSARSNHKLSFVYFDCGGGRHYAKTRGFEGRLAPLLMEVVSAISALRKNRCLRSYLVSCVSEESVCFTYFILFYLF